MSKIRVMDELLSNKIAAGEVVEKCVSVVKELVENSIDALSTVIKIETVDAGTKSIKITDNGIGMDREDAVLAFQRHATSKIKDEEDLYRINTLGFRGEALASIASVSKVYLQTCTNNVGTKVIIEGGIVKEVSNAEARTGTIVEVNNLFYNTPARLKHLKSLYTELANITDYINKIALSHPEIKFTFINNDNVILNTDGTSNLLKNISAIYGINVAKKMVKISASNSDYELEGFMSKPEVQRSTRNGIITLVNGRVVRNQELNKAICDSYFSYKPENRYPIVVLQIKVDPSLVDVNVHPTKMDIKFSKLEELLELVKNLIKEKLKELTLIPNIEVNNTPKEEKHEKKIYGELKFDFGKINEDENQYFVNDSLIKEETIKENIEDNIKEKEETFPKMYIVGEVHGTYIICENELGMYLIDQHAAKERINYELTLDKLSNPGKDKISLLFPLTLEYSNREYIILKENLDFLRDMNFEIEEFGINSVIIKSHPTWLPKNNEVEAIKKVIELVIEKEKNFDISKFRNNLAATMACKMSIKANDSITKEEMEKLIDDLGKCKNPYNCPHGRPTTVFYTNYDLEKLFKRSGFDNIK